MNARFTPHPVEVSPGRWELLNRWTWGPWVAIPCPTCGCNPDKPCTITLADGESTALCVPAGAYDFSACSGCA